MNQETNKNNWQKKLTEQEDPLDIQQFWDKLEPQLPPQKKQRKGAWWIWPSLALIGLGLSVLFALLSKQKAEMAASISSNPVVQNIDVRPDTQINSDVNHSSTPELSRQPDNQTDNATSPKNQRKITNGKNETNRKSIDHTSKQILSADEIHPLLNSASKHQQTPQSTSEKVVQSVSFVQGSEYQKLGKGNSVSELPLSVDARHESVVDALSSRDIQMINIIPGSWSPKGFLLENQNTKTDWQWALTLSGGPGFGLRQLTSTDPAFTEWIEQRRDQESVLESWQVRGMVEVVSPGGFVVETGLQWTRQNERLDWSRDSSVWEWGHADGLLVDQNGGTQPWADTAWQYYTLTRTIRHYNRISTLEIPIGLGYQISNHRWSARVTGGVLINLDQQASGVSIHPDGWPVEWQRTNDPKLATHMGLGYYGHLRFAYDMRAKVTVFIQPSYSAYPGDRQTGNSYSLKYGQANFQIGLQWKLN
jgi:hypothetical protein